MNYTMSMIDEKYAVVEQKQPTNETCVIGYFTDKEEARSVVRMLNLGGGFDGWTPNFMLTKTVNDSINDDIEGDEN